MRVQGANRNPNLTQVAESDTILVQGNPKSKIHNVFIVDASGSMYGSKYHNAINGVNDLLISIGKDTDSENTLTIVEFEENNIDRRVDVVTQIPSKYKGMGTGGGTPLNQAIGETLEYIVNVRNTKFNSSDKVLVNVFTDGEENNSSGKYSRESTLKSYIKELENQDVTVTFIGTKQDVAHVVRNLGINSSNTLIHNNTADDVKRSFETTILARQMYSKSVAKGEDVKTNFYTKTVSQ